MALHQERTHPQYVEGCYACGLTHKALTFRYGRETFHDTTIKETVDDMHRRAKENGRTVEYVGSRWV